MRPKTSAHDEPRTSATLLLEIADSAYARKAWHGPNLKGSLRRVTAEQAAWRPAPDRHNIWEIAVHAAYWKYVVRRKLRGERRGSFPMKGSNWFDSPASPGEKAWAEAKALLEREHRELREAVREALEVGTPRVPPSMLYGVAFHDVYHASQIQLLKRLQARRG